MELKRVHRYFLFLAFIFGTFLFSIGISSYDFFPSGGQVLVAWFSKRWEALCEFSNCMLLVYIVG